jgi:uncharacterized membrane-anchored protein
MLNNHPLRHQLTNELHARPFIPLEGPARAAHIAFKQPKNAARRAPEEDFAHLKSFLERHGGPLPAADEQHYFHDFGRFRLKWERHTEFVSYTIFVDGLGDSPFDAAAAKHFPQDWLDEAPGLVVSAAHLYLEPVEDARAAESRLITLADHFTAESLAAAFIGESEAMVCGDFRIHEDGFSRFAILVCGMPGARRLGRFAQRVLEVETYRAMAMLTLPVARTIAARLSLLDDELSDITARFEAQGDPSELLNRLTALSTEIEAMSAQSAFRFGAAGAYADIVDQRIEIMRESRVGGLQLFSEFMIRRFDPAMRTCRSAEKRLEELSKRAARAANLLRTRINLSLQKQNQKLLVSMNRRAGLQLRLQETVELLSFVAICYSGVSLLGLLLAPFGASAGVDQTQMTAILVLPVIAAVALLAVWVRRRQKRLESEEAGENESG